MELSFYVRFIENVVDNWETGEKHKHRIPYIYKDKQRNYFTDFIISNRVIEIKPHVLTSTEQNVSKYTAAVDFCKRHNKIFEVFTEKMITRITQPEIDMLVKNNDLILIGGKK